MPARPWYMAVGTDAPAAPGWGGANPTRQNDTDTYELGTRFRAVEDVSITHVRVFSDNAAVWPGRHARLWSEAGAELAQVSIDDDLPDGWAQYELAAPVELAAGEYIVVSYESGGFYCATGGAFTAADVPSPDGKVRAVRSVVGHLNGVFNATPGAFPTTEFGQAFYGVDIAYGGGTSRRCYPVRV